jgi:hypothetical protein
MISIKGWRALLYIRLLTFIYVQRKIQEYDRISRENEECIKTVYALSLFYIVYKLIDCQPLLLFDFSFRRFRIVDFFVIVI